MSFVWSLRLSSKHFFILLRVLGRKSIKIDVHYFSLERRRVVFLVASSARYSPSQSQCKLAPNIRRSPSNIHCSPLNIHRLHRTFTALSLHKLAQNIHRIAARPKKSTAHLATMGC
jgi:hypothetical protein